MSVQVRTAEDRDFTETERVFRIAFGTYEKMENPLEAFGDRDMIRSRWKGKTSTVLVAESDGKIIGTNTVTHWGTVGFFGRMAVSPDAQGKGVASSLMEKTMQLFREWRTTLLQTDTWPDSPLHIHLYAKYGFQPRFLTAMMRKPVSPGAEYPFTYSKLTEVERGDFLEQTRDVCSTIYPGLDLTAEVRSVQEQSLGDTVILRDGANLKGFAVCHAGANTEAGSGSCYVKFGGVRKSPDAAHDLKRLLSSCEALASAKGATRLAGGVNTSRRGPYVEMLGTGWKMVGTFVGLHHNDNPGYSVPDTYVVDRWS